MDLLQQSNLNQLLSNTIYQLYQDSTFSGTAGNRAFFCFPWPMQVLDEGMYLNPWSPDNPEGSMLSVERISELVDPIPSFSRSFQPSGNNVSDLYSLVLTSYTLPGQPAARAASLKQEAAPAQLSELELQPLGLELIRAATPQGDIVSTINDPTLATRIASEQADSEQRIRAKAQLLAKGLPLTAPSMFEAAAPILRQAPDATVLPAAPPAAGSLNTVFARAAAVFQSTALASIQNPQLSFHASYVYPTDFADPSGAAGWPLIATQYQVSDGSALQNVKVSYSMCRADIARPWMMSYLLSMRGWGVQEQPVGWLSNGSDTVNSGIFPLLPISLILCRDLSITNESGSLNYSVKGLQVLAYVCQVLPLQPTI